MVVLELLYNNKYMDKKNLDLSPYLIALVISILIGSYLISNSIRSGNEKTCFAVMYKELKKKNSAMESAAAHYRHSQQGKQANT